MKQKYETKKNITKLLIFLKKIENDGKYQNIGHDPKGGNVRSNRPNRNF